MAKILWRPLTFWDEMQIDFIQKEEAKKKAWENYDKWLRHREIVTNCLEQICLWNIFYWEINEIEVILNE